jgi:hypothetical protein
MVISLTTLNAAKSATDVLPYGSFFKQAANTNIRFMQQLAEQRRLGTCTEDVLRMCTILRPNAISDIAAGVSDGVLIVKETEVVNALPPPMITPASSSLSPSTSAAAGATSLAVPEIGAFLHSMSDLAELFQLFTLGSALGVMNLFNLIKGDKNATAKILVQGEGGRLQAVLVRANQAMTMPFMVNFAALHYFGVEFLHLTERLQVSDCDPDVLVGMVEQFELDLFVGLANGGAVRRLKGMIGDYGTKMDVGYFEEGKHDKEVQLIFAVLVKRVALGLYLYIPKDKQITLIEYILNPRVIVTTKRFCSGLHFLHTVAVLDCHEFFPPDGDAIFNKVCSYDLVQQLLQRLVRDRMHLMLVNQVKHQQSLPPSGSASSSSIAQSAVCCVCL